MLKRINPALLGIPVAVLFVLFLLPATAHADVNDFTIIEFAAKLKLSRDDPQGELRVIERISVDFMDNNHGIERALPKSYKGNSLKFHLNSVSSDSGAPTQVRTRSQNGNTILRIGDPTRTVTGRQEYTIDYTLQNVITFYADHDELYWDVNGDQWSQPVIIANAVLELPEGVTPTENKPVCFAGKYGSKAGNCTISAQPESVRASAINLGPNETLTFAVGFQKGFFAPITLRERLMDNIAKLLGLVVLPLTSLGVGWTWWWKRGRDAKGRGTIVPEYEPPKGLSPMRAGAIADFKVDNRDLTATIIDLARRGYLKIIETRQDRLILKDKLAYTIELARADINDLDAFEKTLIEAMFKTLEKGAVMETGTYNSELSAASRSLRKSVDKSLSEDGYFKPRPYKYTLLAGIVGGIMVILVFGLAVITGGGLGSIWPVIVGMGIGTVIIGVFISKLPARTAKGVATREQLFGLKMYMETAEKDRLEKLEGPNAAYAGKAGGPARSVEFFEKLLPFAIIFGVEQQWAAQFKDLYTSPPEWYSGNNLSAFNAGYLASSLSGGMTQALNNTFTPPNSSSGSGFSSGGGFSGGGGGGGGGGGW